MKKKSIFATAVLLATTMLLGACNASNSGTVESEQKESHEVSSSSDTTNTNTDIDVETEAVNITFYTTETGKDEMFMDLIKDFESKNQNISVEYIAAGDDQLQKWMSLYASKEGPTVSLMDPINIYENQERLRDLSGEKLFDNIQEDALSTFTFDGKLYGAPYTAAGIGILYNKTLIDEIIGTDFNPDSIKTRSDLEELFEKIEAAGVSPTMFTGVNWSLGAHYLGLTYGAAVGDVAKRVEKVEQLKEGEFSLKNDPVINGYMDTFDLIAKYNFNKEDPLVGNVNLDAQAFADGEVATWFMGDWAWTYLGPIVEKDVNFGIMPIPYSDEAEDEVNRKLPTSYAKGYCVDQSQNDESQQLAGIKFIEYLTSDKYAEEQLALIAGQAMPYKNFDGKIESPLGEVTAEYVAKGMNFDFYGTPNLLPSDYWYENGAYITEYLDGGIDRDTLYQRMEEYWVNVDK